MQIELQMVGVHRTATMNIKGVQFNNGKGIVTGADELVGNICKYLENYGAWQPHEAERRQAILDGEGDLLGIRAAKRKKEKAEQMIAEANEQILVAQEAVEEKMQADARAETEAATAAALAVAERIEVAKEKQEALDGQVEDQSTTEGRSSESSEGPKSSRSSKGNRR
jgi:hypothetical protein